MKTFLTLFKTALNINFGISALKYRFTRDGKRLWEPVLIGISALFGVGVLMAMISIFMYGLFVMGKILGKPELILTLSMVAGQLVILIFGIFLIMGSFYFSKDLNILVPLPLRPSQVLGSKFAVMMVNEYLLLALFMAPAFIIYGYGMNQGMAYWVKSLVIFLTMPAIPLILGALFVLLLMRFVNVQKNKDLFAIVGGFMGLFAAVGFNFFIQRMPKGNEQELLGSIQSKIVEIVGQKFPPGLWATYGLVRHGIEGLSYLALFISLSVLLFIVLMWIGNQVFYKGFVSGQETLRKRKMLSEKRGLKQVTIERSPVIALFLKEWKLFIRTPIYMMNGISGMVIGPFLLIMPFIADKTAGNQLFEIIQDPKYTLFVSLGGLGVMLFAANMNIIANTSISREGQMFWISKMIPASPKQQILAKILHCIAVETIGIVMTGVVLVIIIKMAVIKVVSLAITGFVSSMLFIILNLMIDVVRPKLEWTNPQEAVKRNMNSFLGMLVTAFVMGILFAFVMLLVLFRLPEWAIFLSLILISTALVIPSAIGLLALAEHRYNRLEA